LQGCCFVWHGTVNYTLFLQPILGGLLMYTCTKWERCSIANLHKLMLIV
jgi:hypothetical protein